MCTVTQSVRPYLALIYVAICIHAHVMIITMVAFVNIYIRFILFAEPRMVMSMILQMSDFELVNPDTVTDHQKRNSSVTASAD
jgi:hypothetical protein